MRWFGKLRFVTCELDELLEVFDLKLVSEFWKEFVSCCKKFLVTESRRCRGEGQEDKRVYLLFGLSI